MLNWETVRLKLRKKYIGVTYKKRRNRIKETNFTIISNNCWGGIIYQSYGLEYKTPTIGLYFLADDYIKFVYNIKEYLKCELTFIKYYESKKYKLTNQEFDFPVGRLNDIDIYFMHYKTQEEAEEKWKRRCERVNWDKILYKFSNQNFCTKEHIEKFLKLPVKNKVCFVNDKRYNIEGTIFIKQKVKTKDIGASYEPFGKHRKININNMINSL